MMNDDFDEDQEINQFDKKLDTAAASMRTAYGKVNPTPMPVTVTKVPTPQVIKKQKKVQQTFDMSKYVSKDQYQKMIKGYQATINKLIQQKDRLEQQKNKLQISYRQQKTTLNQSIDDLTETRKQNKRRIQQIQQQLANINKSHSSNSQIILQKKKLISKYQQANDQVEKQKRELKQQLQKVRDGYKEALYNLQQQKRQIQQKLKQKSVSSNPANGNHHYQKGDFNTYAVKKQKQIKQLNQTIDKIIKQAISSHLNQVQTVLKFSKQSEIQSIKLQKQLLGKFPNKQSTAKFIKDPIQYFLQHKTFGNIKSYVRQFVQCMMLTYKVSIIQNKLTQLGQLKLQQYVKKQNTLIIPSKGYNQAYLKIGKGIQPSFMFQSNNTLKMRSQLSILSQKQRQTILAMVTSYLHDKEIIVSQKQLQNRIKQMITKKI